MNREKEAEGEEREAEGEGKKGEEIERGIDRKRWREGWTERARDG